MVVSINNLLGPTTPYNSSHQYHAKGRVISPDGTNRIAFTHNISLCRSWLKSCRQLLPPLHGMLEVCDSEQSRVAG